MWEDGRRIKMVRKRVDNRNGLWEGIRGDIGVIEKI